MARARNIKPGLFKNELLVEQSLFVRLMFIGLWTLADREGRLEDRPKRIKLELFPYDQDDTNEALSVLAENGFIERYQADGKSVIQIVNFLKHQTPHGTEKDSELPAKDGSYNVNFRNGSGYVTGSKRANNVKKAADNVSLPGSNGEDPSGKRPDILNPDSLNPESGIEKQSAVAGKKSGRSDYTDEFEKAWKAYPSRPGASKADSFKAWNARLSSGADPLAITAGVNRYAAYCIAVNVEPQFIKQPSTFFGPSEHYLSDWSIPQHRAVAAVSRPTSGRQASIDNYAAQAAAARGNHDESNGGQERDITGQCQVVA